MCEVVRAGAVIHPACIVDGKTGRTVPADACLPRECVSRRAHVPARAGARRVGPAVAQAVGVFVQQGQHQGGRAGRSVAAGVRCLGPPIRGLLGPVMVA